MWETQHEALLNFVDDETRSKVLLSSRLRGIILGGLADQQATTIVDISLPSEDDAVKMLLSTGGMPVDQSVPSAAYELVKLCNRLPLAISIAGKLIKELEYADTDDKSTMWADIVQVMKEEFESNKTVGETVISTSIKGLRGAQRENIVLLFKSLALIPEDTPCPLNIMAMIFEASCATTADSVPATAARPSIVSIRRWLKMLIDRSLVLGTVDCPSLHDIVRDYVIDLFPAHELKAAHFRLVNCLRASRPNTVMKLGEDVVVVKEWRLESATDSTTKYVRANVIEHIRQSNWNVDANPEFLTDLPQDDIVAAAASLVGAEKLGRLTDAAETAGDTLTCAKLAALAGKATFQGEGRPPSVPWFTKAEEHLLKLSGTETSVELRDCLDRMEINVLMNLFAGNSGFDEYGDRPDYLAATRIGMTQAADEAGFLFFYNAQTIGFGGCLTQTNEDFTRDVMPLLHDMFLKFVHCQARGAATLTSRNVRERCMLLICTTALFKAMLHHKTFDWDTLFGRDGSYCKVAMAAYDYEIQHAWLSNAMPMDVVLMGGVAPDVLAIHYGDPGSVQPMLHKCMDVFRRVLDEPAEERAMKWFEVFFFHPFWAPYVLLTRDPGDLASFAAMMTRASLTWSTAESTVQANKHHSVYITDPALGRPGLSTAEHTILLNKLLWVLVAVEPGVTAEEVMASLPSPDEMQVMMLGTAKTSTIGGLGGMPSAPMLLALVCERFGRFQEALPWALAAASEDCSKLGTKNIFTHAQAHRAYGRCLEKLGKAKEAAGAFEHAAKIGATAGLHLEVLLALSELHSSLRDQHASEDLMARMKLAVHEMLGAEPAPAKLKSLAKAKLAPGVTLDAIMAA